MPQYLTSDWFKAAQDALDNAPDVAEATRGQKALVQEVVTGAPHGDVTFSMHFEDGAVKVSEGPIDNPDVTMRTDYETAAALQRGELNTMSAFMGGRLKLDGDLTRVMGLQKAQSAFDEALKSIDTQY